MLLSIIIVNYKTPALVVDCLKAISETNRPLSSYEIFVVDNNSDDGMEAVLQNNFPTVKFIQMGYNAGFARANNAAMRVANGDAFLLLNSDTIPKQHSIDGPFELLIASGYAACGVQLLNADGSPQISGNFAMRGGLNYLLPLPFVGNFLRNLALNAGAQKPNIPEAKNVEQVDWINGAYLMVKKAVVDKAGLMDEDFFLYAEEAEWCSRIKKVGPLCIYGAYHVIHLQGESAGSAFNSEAKGYRNIFDKKGKQIILSNLLRIRKEFGLFWFFVIYTIYLLTIPVFFFGLLAQKILNRRQSYTYDQLTGFADNMIDITGFLPSIVFNRRRFYKVL